MDRVDKILNHNLFIEHIARNDAAEADRSFCRHNIAHLLDVVRIAMILNLEEGLFLDKEVVYGAALLHDIGKHVQYEEGTPHEQAGAVIASDILKECGYSDLETDVIVDAIRNHRTEGIAEEKSLNGVLYRADKSSRPCFACNMEKLCNWKKEKKNMQIKY